MSAEDTASCKSGGVGLEKVLLFVCLLCFQVLIFSEKKAEVDDIHEYLLLKGVQAVSIHGGKGKKLATLI